MDDNRGESRIESLKKKLFSKNEGLLRKRKEATFTQKDFGVSETWPQASGEAVHEVAHDANHITGEAAGSAENNAVHNPVNISEPISENYMHTFKKSSSLFKKFFIGAAIFLVVGVVYAGLMLYGGGNTVSNDRVIITITGNAFTAGGEELPIDVSVKNQNAVSIDSANLIIEYPRGSSASAAGDYDRKTIALTSIAPGQEIDQHISVILYGEQGTTKDIRARLEYTVRGSSSTFIKQQTYTIQINTAPLAITIDAPADSVSDQNYEFKTHVTVASTHLASSTIVKVDYPPGFQFSDATPKPIINNNIFALGKTDVGSDNLITVHGKIVGVDGDSKDFKVSAGEQDPTDQAKISVVYNSVDQEVVLGKPFINARLTLGGIDQDVYAINASATNSVSVEWSNNLPTAVNDLVVTAKLYGNALNKSSIQSAGFYDSNTNSIIWDKNTVSDLATVQPGQHGTLTFNFASQSLLSGPNSVIPDPTVTVEISAKGSQPAEGVAVKEVDSFEKKDFKVNTDLQLSGKTLYSTGPIHNTGPLPPKAGSETTYTIEWKITNTSNKIGQAEIRATLPVNVTFGGLDPTSNENLSYNDTTKEVVWTIGSVARGAGFVGAAKTVDFQVKFTPSTSQVGSIPTLVSDATLSATDLFTTTALQKTTTKLMTLITGEPGFPANGGTVVQ